MKSLLTIILTAALLAVSGCTKYDDSELRVGVAQYSIGLCRHKIPDALRLQNSGIFGHDRTIILKF
ncbi:MAG: hypothetical protein LBI89_04290 [Prevotellaceae bacterium]|jgi:hypothetical protein|nr:hypothetical protein [Prevotellaceae bacterium]